MQQNYNNTTVQCVRYELEKGCKFQHCCLRLHNNSHTAAAVSRYHAVQSERGKFSLCNFHRLPTNIEKNNVGKLLQFCMFTHWFPWCDYELATKTKSLGKLHYLDSGRYCEKNLLKSFLERSVKMQILTRVQKLIVLRYLVRLRVSLTVKRLR